MNKMKTYRQPICAPVCTASFRNQFEFEEWATNRIDSFSDKSNITPRKWTCAMAIDIMIKSHGKKFTSECFKCSEKTLYNWKHRGEFYAGLDWPAQIVDSIDSRYKKSTGISLFKGKSGITWIMTAYQDVYRYAVAYPYYVKLKHLLGCGALDFLQYSSYWMVSRKRMFDANYFLHKKNIKKHSQGHYSKVFEFIRILNFGPNDNN